MPHQPNKESCYICEPGKFKFTPGGVIPVCKKHWENANKTNCPSCMFEEGHSQACRYYTEPKNPMEKESWEERLQFEIMEDYLTTAKLGHLAKDQKKHKEEMRWHWESLKSFITSVREEAYQQGIRDGKKIERYGSISGSQPEYQV